MYLLIFFLLIVLGTIDYVEVTAVLVPFSDCMSEIIVLEKSTIEKTLFWYSCACECDFETLLNQKGYLQVTSMVFLPKVFV